jgi:hypothetical protein
LRAGESPPICEMWMRMKSISRSLISGTYSSCVLKPKSYGPTNANREGGGG